LQGLPRLALSVRQPWAWAIVQGGKEIENRSLGAIRAGRMVPGTICLHAASGMRRDEYRYGQWRLARHGVICPRPDDLVRGAIIGTVEVTGIVTQSARAWFGGEAGLTLAKPQAIDPIPARGALGYFAWEKAGDFAPVKPWMRLYDRPFGDTDRGELFDDAPPSLRSPPP
jgi:hypothetical protein